MLSLWANWLVTKFGLNSLKRYLWPVLYVHVYMYCMYMYMYNVCIAYIHVQSEPHKSSYMYLQIFIAPCFRLKLGYKFVHFVVVLVHK